MLGCASFRGSPRNVKLLLLGRAIAKIEVDERLIANPGLVGECLEVRNGAVIEPDGHLTLQAPRVRIALRLGEIVFLPHRAHLWLL